MSEREGIQPKLFTIAIEETIVQEFKIEASDIGEALEIAEKKYKSGELVLEDAEAQFVQMCANDGLGDCTEWTQIR